MQPFVRVPYPGGGPPVLPLRFRIRRTPGRWRGCAGRRRRAGCRWRRCSLRWSRSTGWRRGSLRRCGSLRTCSGWRVHAGSRRPRAHPRRTRPHGGRRSCWPRVALADQLHVENQLGFRRNRTFAGIAIPQFVRNEQAALAADMHSFEPGVPARNHLMRPVGKRDRLAAVTRRVELRPVGQIARVVDRQPFARFGDLARPNLRIDVVQRIGRRSAAEFVANRRAHQRRGVVQLRGRRARHGVEDFRAWSGSRERRDLRRQLRRRHASGCGPMRPRSCGRPMRSSRRRWRCCLRSQRQCGRGHERENEAEQRTLRHRSPVYAKAGLFRPRREIMEVETNEWHREISVWVARFDECQMANAPRQLSCGLLPNDRQTGITQCSTSARSVAAVVISVWPTIQSPSATSETAHG